MIKYQILNDGKVAKVVSAKGLASIHRQFSTYAEKRGAVSRENNCLVCPFAWVLPDGSILSLLRILD